MSLPSHLGWRGFVTKARGRARWLAPFLCAIAQCASPIDAPSAFTTETYLCDEESLPEFEALVDACLEQRNVGNGCAGVLSLRGLIDGEPVVVDTLVNQLTIADEPTANGNRSRALDFIGPAPYFSLRVTLYGFEALPGSAPAPPLAPPRDVVVLEARGGNYLSQVVDQVRDVQLHEPDAMRVKVSARLTRGGTVDFCFHVFP